MMKKLVIGIGVVIVILAAALFWAVQNIDGLVKSAIESSASLATHTEVTVGDVSISLNDGRGELGPLLVSNPSGFSSDYALRVEAAVLHVDPATLADKVIVIKEVTIDGASLIAELNANGSNNLQMISSNLSSGRPAESTSGESQSSSGNPLRMRIEKFVFNNGDVRLVAPEMKERVVELPTLRLENVGGANGATSAELSSLLLGEIIDQGKGIAKKELGRQAKDAALKKLEKELSDDDKAKLDAFKSLLK